MPLEEVKNYLIAIIIFHIARRISIKLNTNYSENIPIFSIMLSARFSSLRSRSVSKPFKRKQQQQPHVETKLSLSEGLSKLTLEIGRFFSPVIIPDNFQTNVCLFSHSSLTHESFKYLKKAPTSWDEPVLSLSTF